MLTPREKSPPPEKFSSEEDRTYDPASSLTASPPLYQRDIPASQVIPVTLKIGSPVTTLPAASCYRISAGTGWPGVSNLWLCEIASLQLQLLQSSEHMWP